MAGLTRPPADRTRLVSTQASALRFLIKRSSDNESPTRRPGRGRRKAGHGWPAAASQAWMPAEPGSISRSGRRYVRSPRAAAPCPRSPSSFGWEKSLFLAQRTNPPPRFARAADAGDNGGPDPCASARIRPGSDAQHRRPRQIRNSANSAASPTHMSETPKILYTLTAEAPWLATQSLLPVVQAYAATAGI